MPKAQAHRDLRALEREVERAVDTRPPGMRRREARRRAAVSAPPRGRARKGVRRPKARNVIIGRPVALRRAVEPRAERRKAPRRGTREFHDRRGSHAVAKRRRKVG